jgi:hypothetical protein
VRISLVVLASLTLLLATPPKESGTTIDSGAFQVMVDGKHVATETFKIQQTAGRSVSTSTIKVVGSKNEQSSVLEMTSSGELVRYAWRELSPTKAQTTVEVTSGTLLQRVMAPDAKKPMEVPYMTSPSTFVLDDNFFTHRQLLLWRYMAGSCQAADNKLTCAPSKLGILVPAQHVMAVVSISLVGSEKVAWKGVERDLLHLKLALDDVAWDIWVDPADSYKMIKILIPSSKTEVLRS